MVDLVKCDNNKSGSSSSCGVYSGGSHSMPATLDNYVELASEVSYPATRRNSLHSIDTPFSLYSFTIPGYGERPSYCGSQKVSEYALDGSGAVARSVQCHRAMCPYCNSLWRANKVFDWTFRIEAYSMSNGQRPAVGECSIHPDRLNNDGFALKDLRNEKQKKNRRLKRGGVNAAVSIFHSFRIKNWAKDSIRRILQKDDISSSGFWAFIRSDDGLRLISEDVGFEVRDIHSLLKLGFHDHLIMFPNYAKPTGNHDLMIRKEKNKDGSIRILETYEDTIRHLGYLSTHIGIPNRRFQIEPITGMGDLHNFNPESVLSDDEIEQLRNDILEFMNQDRDVPLVYDPERDELVYSVSEDDKEDLPETAPIGDLLAFTELDKMQVDDHINMIFTDPVNAEYMRTVVYLMWDLNKLRIPNALKSPYTCLLPPPPDSFTVYGDEARFSQANYDRLYALICKREKVAIGCRWNMQCFDPDDVNKAIEGACSTIDKSIQEFIEQCLEDDKDDMY